MSLVRNGTGVSDTTNTRNQTISDIQASLDLVTAARRHLAFLRAVAESQLPYNNCTLLHSIRRYDELWMPLFSDISTSSSPPILLPPFDIQWVWHCHTLNPVSYQTYCESRFSKILEKPVIFDGGNEEYALNRCRDVWISRYPSEPFELETLNDIDSIQLVVANEELFQEVSKHKFLYSKFSEPYMPEMVYLISARERYRAFLYLLQRLKDGCVRFVPTLDIHLMWLTHQSYPLKYAEDVKEMREDLAKVVGVWEEVRGEDVEVSKKTWEGMFDQPYEKASGTLDGIVVGGSSSMKLPLHWEVWDVDVNTKYKTLEPRFLLEVCVFLRRKLDNNLNILQPQQHKNYDKKKSDNVIRARTIRCHRQLKMETPITSIPFKAWQRTCHLYCEFSTRGLSIDFKRNTSRKLTLCVKSSSRPQRTTTFFYNDLLRAPNLTLEGKDLDQELRVVISITPPAQAPYLIKCVPDRVTDDSGAMVSEEILRMNGYRPQEGRWLSRTVLDHNGRECFVVRIRVATGIWRRGDDIPRAVKREDRIVEVRQGSWNYVAGSIGNAPEKVVGTATPKEEDGGQREQRASWILSTGDELTIEWTPTGPSFHLHNNTTPGEVRLLNGRRMQYQVNKEDGEEEEGFVTIVRYTEDFPNGRTTALMNWRLLAMEITPEEDAVLVLLLCIAILRSVSEITREDIGRLLVRRRVKEPKLGLRDWGSVILHPSSCSSIQSSSSDHLTHLQPWYWNTKAVMAPDEADDTRQSTFSYSSAEGGDKLYKQVILPSSRYLIHKHVKKIVQTRCDCPLQNRAH